MDNERTGSGANSSPAPHQVSTPTAGIQGNHSSKKTTPILAFIDPWTDLARASLYALPEFCRRMGLTHGQLEHLRHGPRAWPVEAWLHLVRIWDAAFLLWHGHSQSEIESFLEIEDPRAFWILHDDFVDVVGWAPEQVIRIHQPIVDVSRPAIESIPGSLRPAAADAPSPRLSAWWRLSPFCHQSSRTSGNKCPPAGGCGLVADCLFRRVCGGVDLGKEALAALVVTDQGLRKALQAKWPSADEHCIIEAIGEAARRCVENPCGFDPERGASLLGLVRGIALRCLRDRQRSENRQWGRMTGPLPDEEVLDRMLAPLASKVFPADLLLDAEGAEMLRRFIQRQSPVDQAILRLMLAGKRHWSAYAEVLRIANLPLSEQRHFVNKLKERVRLRLKRYFLGTGR